MLGGLNVALKGIRGSQTVAARVQALWLGRKLRADLLRGGALRGGPAWVQAARQVLRAVLLTLAFLVKLARSAP